MSKYVIRNCPATGAGCCGDTCSEITYCPLKQIVELCKEDWEDMTVSKFQSELLNKLDIQEVE